MRRVYFEMDCVTVYHRFVTTMFEDGIVNAGRLYVVYVFTQSYCTQYPDRAWDIWTAYNRVVEGLRCVPSSTNQQSGNMTNQKSPFRPISQSESTKKNQSENRVQKETTNRLYRYKVDKNGCHSGKSCAVLRKWWTIWSVEWKTENPWTGDMTWEKMSTSSSNPLNWQFTSGSTSCLMENGHCILRREEWHWVFTNGKNWKRPYLCLKTESQTSSGRI